MQGTVQLSQHPQALRGLYRLRFPFVYNSQPHINLKDDLKRIPGCEYTPEIAKGFWTAAIGAEPEIAAVAAEHGLDFKVPNRSPTPWGKPTGHPHKKARPYQIEHSENAIRKGYYLFRFEMRLGKTLTTIEALRRGQIETALIVCPSIARGVWRDELRDWWPDHPTVAVIKNGKEAAALLTMPDNELPQILITSFILAQREAFTLLKYDALVFDESQNLTNSRSARSEAMRLHVVTNPKAMVLELTGTPIRNQADDLYGQLDTLSPGAWGSYPKWCDHFCASEPNEFAHSGKKYIGLRDDRIDELKRRMAPLIGDVTKESQKHLLPPLITRNIYIDSSRSWTMQSFDDVFEDQHRIHTKRFDHNMAKAGNIKVEHSLYWIANAQQEGVAIPCVLTHLNDTAEAIAEGCKKFDPLLLSGRACSSPDKRYSLLTEYRKRDKGIIIATMHSVGVAVDLTCCTAALFAELYWDPLTVEQALSRFHGMLDRKGKKVTKTNEAASVEFLIAKGTLDEVMIAALRPKVDNILKVLKKGQADATLQTAMKRKTKTQEQFALDMRRVAESMIGSAEY